MARPDLTEATLTIQVSDDGVGVRSVTQPGIGMTSMRERAEELGGTLDVAPADTSGTRVTAVLPITTPVGRSAVDRAAVPSARPPRSHSAVPPMVARDG